MNRTLIIDRFYSQCGNCSANIVDIETVERCPDCNQPFMFLSSNYANMKEACVKIRPDLHWTGFEL